MSNDKLTFTSRLANAGLLVKAAVSEMIGRDSTSTGNGMSAIGQIRATFGGYKEVSTFDISRTSYSLARAIYYANLYKDRRTGKEYGKDYLLGAPFGKPIVNIAAGFAVGSPIQIAESHEVTEEDDTEATDEDKLATSLPTPTTVSNVNRMLQDRRDVIYSVVRNHYRDGDSFVVVEDDGSFVEIPPEDVDVITNPDSPDQIDGYDIWTTFTDPKDPSGATVLTFVDEIRRTYRRRMQIDKSNNRKEVPGTKIDYRNAQDGGLEERELPVVHFANDKEPRSLYGISEYQNLYYLMANYHAVLSAAIKGNIYNSTALPVIQGVKNMKQFLNQNFQQDKDGNYVLKWDNQKMLVVGEGGSVQILQANGTAADAQTLLNILFWLISQASETPEFAFGTAVQSSKASVSEQTPMLIKKAVRNQGELETPIRKLIELYITRMATVKPDEFDADTEFIVEMPSILDEDLNINIAIVNMLLEKGIITEETAMTMLNLGKYVKNFDLERKRARQQQQERSPIPTDVFGQPINNQDDEDDEINQAKQAEIDEMLQHSNTKHVAEMLSKNLNSMTLEQIQEMNPHRGSEGKDPKAVQEQLKVKSGNPYRQAGGKFGHAPVGKKESDLESKIANAKDMPVEEALYNYQDYEYQNINGYLALSKRQEAGETLDAIDQKDYDKILTHEDRVLSHIKAIDGQFANETSKDQQLYRTDADMMFHLIQDNPKLASDLATLSAEGKIPRNHTDLIEGDDSYVKTLEKHLIGKTYDTGAYISTSRTQAGANKFGDGSSLSSNSAEIHLTLTGKSKGIRVDAFTGSGVEGNIENETLLPRGTGILINGIKLTPTQREGYSGTRGEVFFVEISGKIIPIDVTDPKSRKKAVGEMAKAISVKSGNPYRQAGGRFGSGPAIDNKDDVGKDLAAAADMEVNNYDEMLEQRIALTEIKESYAEANGRLDEYKTSNKLILEWTQDSDATHDAMEKAGKLAKDGKGDMALEYEMTQAYFKERGITELELYRGISGDEATRISDMVTATNFVTLAPDYASSWTSDLTVANKFTQYNGVIIKRTIPVKDIMAAWNINPHMSTYGESEFLVIQGQVVKLTGDDVGRIRYETNKN